MVSCHEDIKRICFLPASTCRDDSRWFKAEYTEIARLLDLVSRSQFCVNGGDFIPVQQTWGKLNLIDLTGCSPRCILPTGLECLQLTRHEYGWSNQWPKPNCGAQPVGHRGHCHCFARKLYMVWLRISASRNWTKSWAGHDLLQPLSRAFLPPVVELESWSERGLIRSWI